MGDSTAKLFGRVVDLLAGMSHDELRVFHCIASRVHKGREVYGPLDLSSDSRNWRGEAADERADLVWYDCCDEVAREDRRRERLECFVADEIAPGLAELAEVE